MSYRNVITTSKIFDDENLIEIINLFKNYLNKGETK